MFAKIKSFFSKKKIAFIDGDQDIPKSLDAYRKYIANTNTETYFVKVTNGGHAEPKLLRKLSGVNKVYLDGMTAGKEITDKFIGAYIQKAVSEGYKEITVISNDYDFIDIFKMAVKIEPKALNITFRMIMPSASGRSTELPGKITNIEIIK